MLGDVDNELHLTDFRMAGFLVARGQKFVRMKKNDDGDTVFIFHDRSVQDGMTASEILNLYPGSPEYQYDAACRAMHDFVKMNGSLKGTKNKR